VGEHVGAVVDVGGMVGAQRSGDDIGRPSQSAWINTCCVMLPLIDRMLMLLTMLFL
jgi:hypothetical protein